MNNDLVVVRGFERCDQLRQLSNVHNNASRLIESQHGRQGKPRRSKLDLHRDYILVQIEAEPEITITEMLDKLASERGVGAARARGSPGSSAA